MEQNLQKILELSLDIHYYYKYSESSFSYVSPALLEHFGIEPAALVGNNYHFFLENVHPEDRDLFESHWNYITQHPDSTSASCDYRCRTKSG
ncbi:MAG TPA: PAS domain-containing protein, partial [Bacteroidales bacterium]|nr:PAS domain-containing protein [Bacteroidales bacterium]